MKTTLGLLFTLSLTNLTYAQELRKEVVHTPGKIEVYGVIDGGIVAPSDTGDTLDYLRFEVVSSGNVTFTMTREGSMRHYVGPWGNGINFDYYDHPNYLRILENINPIESYLNFTVNLSPGEYVVSTGKDRFYENEEDGDDIKGGLWAIDQRGGGFTFGLYAFAIEGDVRPLAFYDGNLNNTFTITTFPVPEPSAYALLALGLAAIAWTRRRK